MVIQIEAAFTNIVCLDVQEHSFNIFYMFLRYTCENTLGSYLNIYLKSAANSKLVKAINALNYNQL